jgi:biotin carboxyl carrier protein
MNLITGIIKRNRKYFLLAVLIPIAIIQACHHKAETKTDDGGDDSDNVHSKIDVTITSPRIGSISQYQILNATTVYMLSDALRAPINGYIRKMNVTTGQMVKEGDVLFTIQNKEAAAMNAIKDTSLHINGTILVKAMEAGIVKTITHQLGDYVQDGDELCNIANSSSLVFMLDVPFEMRQFIKEGGAYTITLPDEQIIQAHITSRIAEMDKTVQMERYVMRANGPLNLPAGLIASVKIPTNDEDKAIILPKSAVLCNETQVQFWVMKLFHDSLAIKVPIIKGAETKDSVEITSPVFLPGDKILISGNYGIPDTALVKVIH